MLVRPCAAGLRPPRIRRGSISPGALRRRRDRRGAARLARAFARGRVREKRTRSEDGHGCARGPTGGQPLGADSRALAAAMLGHTSDLPGTALSRLPIETRMAVVRGLSRYWSWVTNFSLRGEPARFARPQRLAG